MYKSINRILSQTSLVYAILFGVFIVNMLVTIGGGLFDSSSQGLKVALQQYIPESGVLQVIGVTAGLIIAQSSVLIASLFSFNTLFGMSKKVCMKEFIIFAAVKSLLISLFLNIIILSFSIIPNITFLPKIICGFKFHMLDGFALRFFFLALISFTIYSLCMWYTVGFKKYGVLIGIARIVLVLTYVINHLVYAQNFIKWGENLTVNVLVLILVCLLANISTYKEMSTFQNTN